MKLSNRDIYDSREALQRLVARPDIPARYGIEIARMAKKLGDEIGLIDQQRVGLVKKYGKPEGRDFVVEPDTDEFDKFLAEMDELLDANTELIITKARVPNNIDIAVVDLMHLDPFIEIVDAERTN